MRALALVLVLAALPALAQETRPAPQKEERRPLNLKLDNPGRWATVAPSDEKQEKQELPGLGEGARAMPTEVPRSETRTPFPKDSNPGR